MCSYIQDKFRKIHKHILKLLIITFSHCIFLKKLFTVKLLLLTQTMLWYFTSSGYISVLIWLYFYLPWGSIICSFLKNDSQFLETLPFLYLLSSLMASLLPHLYILETSESRPLYWCACIQFLPPSLTYLTFPIRCLVSIYNIVWHIWYF